VGERCECIGRLCAGHGFSQLGQQQLDPDAEKLMIVHQQNVEHGLGPEKGGGLPGSAPLLCRARSPMGMAPLPVMRAFMPHIGWPFILLE
jgi:hypothetical protein